MPLVTGKAILDRAAAEGYAVPSFNTSNLETTQAILGVAEQVRAPVLVQVSDSARKYAGMETLSNLIRDMAARASVPVALHLDHGADYAMVLQALRAGFTSVMIDASHHPLEENIELTRRCAEAAHAVGVSIEAEIGRLGGIEDQINVSAEDAFLTDPDEARRFHDETGVDYLAVAIGTSHGAFKGKSRPFIDHARLGRIAALVPIPLVLHGASGVPTWLVERLRGAGGAIDNPVGIHEDDVRRSIANRVAKVNIDTDLRLAMTAGMREALQDPTQYDLRKVLGHGRDLLAQVAREKFELLGAAGRA